MRLNDILARHDDESILLGMSLLYDVEEDREDYIEVLGRLRTMQPVETGMRIAIELLSDDGDDGFYDVSGHDGTMRRNSDREVDYELDFTSWEEWLGMEVETDTANRMQEVEILAHCLWSMTVVAFNPDDFDNMDETTEKGGVISMPLDDFFDEFEEFVSPGQDDFLDEFDESDNELEE